MIKRKLMAMSLAVCGAFGTGASANTVTNVDLGFILDFSGSISDLQYAGARDALADAIGQIQITADVSYTVGVVKFNAAGSNVIIPPVKLTSNAVRNQFVLDLKATTDNTTGNTCYDCGFDQLKDNWGTLGDVSIANFFTDGANNTTGRAGSDEDANALAAAKDLKDAGWDALGFEAVDLSASNLTKLQALGFDSQLVDANDITAGLSAAVMGNCTATTSDDPLTDCFVLNLATFDAFEAAIGQKVASIVTDTGGEINPVPLPAGMPLLLAGLGAFAVMRRRKKA